METKKAKPIYDNKDCTWKVGNILESEQVESFDKKVVFRMIYTDESFTNPSDFLDFLQAIETEARTMREMLEQTNSGKGITIEADCDDGQVAYYIEIPITDQIFQQ